MYIFFSESKRKVDEELENPVSSKMKKLETRKCSDLIVLGLPWKSTEDDMENYFKQFGELILTQVNVLGQNISLIFNILTCKWRSRLIMLYFFIINRAM